jgi:hypothetical protein
LELWIESSPDQGCHVQHSPTKKQKQKQKKQKQKDRRIKKDKNKTGIIEYLPSLRGQATLSGDVSKR